MTRTNGPGPPRRTPTYAAKHEPITSWLSWPMLTSPARPLTIVPSATSRIGAETPKREAPPARLADAAVEDRRVHVGPRPAGCGDADRGEGERARTGRSRRERRPRRSRRTSTVRSAAAATLVLGGVGDDVLADVTHCAPLIISAESRAERRRRRVASRRRSVRSTSRRCGQRGRGSRSNSVEISSTPTPPSAAARSCV